MPKKNIVGENNPFYGKKHTEESKRKMGGAVKDYSGDKNPFYGKKHKAESIERMKKSMSEVMSGEKNPFYGKAHTQEAIINIINKNKIFRDNNKDLIIERNLARLNLTRDILSFAFSDYINSEKNADDISLELNVDKRVFFKYVELLGIATSEEIKEIKNYKKFKLSRSAQELKLYNLFVKKYGKENVIWSYRCESYMYDFFLFDELFVEYDGYYWHTFFKTNDKNKDELAAKLNKKIFRIKEDSKRYVDFEYNLDKIDEVINEIKAKKNR
jgi:hypothetical protein